MWSAAEQAAWAPPERMTASQWAERNRYLPPTMTGEPGRWSNSRTPYLVGIMDAENEPGVREIVLVKGVQVGGSEATRNTLGKWIEQDPGPAMFVMPSKKAADEMVEERIKPLLLETPSLRRHVSSRSDDTTLESIKLDTMSIYTAWAGSPQALATRPIRYIVFDEVDKYPPFAGREADPISLGLKRLTTYGHRARALILSTPTTREGNVWRRWEMCGDQRHYHVPCPHCGEYQTLLWSHVKWPKITADSRAEEADAIEQRRLAWYECAKCQSRIEDRHKPRMLEAGVWAGSDQVVTRDGVAKGPRPKAKRIGFHLNSLYSPWVGFSQLAAEWLLAQDGGAAGIMDFRNARLAEPYEQIVASPKASAFVTKVREAAPSLVVPSWAGVLTASADTQKDHFWFTVRAWGHRFRSQLIRHGMARSFEELEERCLGSYPMQGSSGMMRVKLLVIDSGGGKVDEETSRVDEVYRFAQRKPDRIFPTKGASHKQHSPIRFTRVTYQPPGGAKRPYQVNLHLIDTAHFKDAVARHIAIEIGDDGEWLLNSAVDDEYVRQMTSERKIVIQHGSSKSLEWRPVTGGAANHLWDCEVLQFVAAEMANVATIPPAARLAAMRKPEKKVERKAEPPKARSDGGWVSGWRGKF